MEGEGLMYVAIGYQGAGHTFQRVLAVSADKSKMDAFVDGLRQTIDMRNLLDVVVGAQGVFMHEGAQYQKIEVWGPVLSLDGPQVVIAGNIGTIHM